MKHITLFLLAITCSVLGLAQSHADQDAQMAGFKLYKVVTTKKTYATGLSIDKDNKLETFRFDTSSPHINKLLKAAK